MTKSGVTPYDFIIHIIYFLLLFFFLTQLNANDDDERCRSARSVIVRRAYSHACRNICMNMVPEAWNIISTAEATCSITRYTCGKTVQTHRRILHYCASSSSAPQSWGVRGRLGHSGDPDSNFGSILRTFITPII